jgi:hypothetical protein
MTDPRITLAGLPLFGQDDAGVSWFVPQNGLDWSGSAGSSLSVQKRPRANGGWAGDAFLLPRSYSLTVVVEGPTRAAVERALDRLVAAASLAGASLSVLEDSGLRTTEVRRDDEPIVTWFSDTAAQLSVGLVAPDPRKFGESLSASTSLPSTAGGLTVPFTVPFSINATTVTGQVSLSNPGNIAGPVLLRIDGPVQGPVVTHVSSGRSLVFASSVVLGAGEWVDVDMERREVLANGQASRNGWVTQRGWSQFVPGENSWAFTAAAFDPAASLTVAATPAWM